MKMSPHMTEARAEFFAGIRDFPEIQGRDLACLKFNQQPRFNLSRCYPYYHMRYWFGTKLIMEVE